MIVTRTPLRVSFFGGGSDIPEFWKRHHPGLCVSAAINRYIYIAVNRCRTDHIRVVYSDMEVVNDVNELRHDRVRESLKMFGITSNVEVCSFSDVPTKGTGLGSSSTFTVGLLNALGQPISRTTLANMAAYVEIDLCKEPIGYQDQYAATFGGLRKYRFTGDEITTDQIEGSVPYVLEENLLCFNTGINRAASSVLQEQVKNLEEGVNVAATKKLVDIAEYSTKLLNERRYDDFGALLDETWQEKKKLSSNVTNPDIDDMYERAVKAGALGGKILGAGGGGYLLLYVPEKSRRSVLKEMREFERFDFKFDHEGSKVELS